MSGILSILEYVTNTGSTKKKQEILKSHKDNVLLERVFTLAYNAKYVYGLKRVPMNMGFYSATSSLSDGLDFLETVLATRKLTGNAAIAALTDVIKNLSAQDAEVIRRVIMRDLECGASGSTAVKVWGGHVCPTQPCMKASSYSEKAISKITFPAFAQLKADGTRCMFIKHNGIVTAWSRNGKLFIGLNKIAKLIEDSEQDNFVLDGELVYVEQQSSSIDFLFGDDASANTDVSDRQTGNGIISKALSNSITQEEADNVVFQSWDYIDVDAYWDGKWNVPYSERFESTKNLVGGLDSHRITVIETTTVYNISEARKLYTHYLDLDLEGIILKNKFGIWEDRRSANQVKFKEVIDIDMIIVGYYAHKKDKNKLGGFTVESKCGKIRCNVGSGFSDTTHIKNGEDKFGEAIWEYIPLETRNCNDRELIMSKADSYINTVGELMCNGVLTRKNKKSGESPYKLFLPIWKQSRIDKDPEDANTYEEIFG